MTGTLVHSATLVDATGERPGWVHVADGSIAAVGTGDDWRGVVAGLPAVEVVDASGSYVTPGFVDIHGHGGGGAAYEEGTEAALTALAAQRAHGTTRAVGSFVTNPIPTIVASLSGVREAMALDAGLIGVHLEGPFLALGRKGAHDPALLLAPDAHTVSTLLDAGAGVIRQITIAPELPGALESIPRFVEAGVRVAVGHTDCDYEQAKEAFARGASLVTHAFNAMAPIQGRLPGVIGAAVEAPHVTIEVIADGVHVHPASIALLFAAAPGRIALVTDAMAAAAAAEGRYLLGGLEVDVLDGRAVIAGTDTLAGSTLTLDWALRTVVNQTNLSLPDAVAALTTTPARAIGESDTPTLDVGQRGDLVVLSKDLHVDSVIVR